MNTKEILKKLKDNDPDLHKPGYGQYCNFKINSICGPATWFATFSPVEYDWEELVEYIREQNADLSGAENLSDTELLAKDPV